MPEPYYPKPDRSAIKEFVAKLKLAGIPKQLVVSQELLERMARCSIRGHLAIHCRLDLFTGARCLELERWPFSGPISYFGCSLLKTDAQPWKWEDLAEIFEAETIGFVASMRCSVRLKGALADA